MTEKKKRFFESMYEIIDREKGRKLQMYEIIDLLNEQQSIIRRDERSIQTMMSNMKKLEKENERLKQPLPYDNIYHRTSKQLENHLKDNGFPVDTVSRSNVGDLSFYHIEFNLSDDEWKYEKTNDLQMRKLLGIRNVGLVDFHKQDGMIHEVILVSEKELNDKYLKDGNLVFK